MEELRQIALYLLEEYHGIYRSYLDDYCGADTADFDREIAALRERIECITQVHVPVAEFQRGISAFHFSGVYSVGSAPRALISR